MSCLSFTVRNFRSDDLENFIEFCSVVEYFNPNERVFLCKTLKEEVRRPGFFPEKDMFFAEVGKHLVGWMFVIPELRIKRAIINGFIHPRYRQQGVAAELLKCTLSRANQLKARKAHVYISQDNTAAKRFLSKFGFIPVRSFLELRVELSELIPYSFNIDSVELAPLMHGQEAVLTRIQNRCFKGSWGFSPNNLEEINGYLNLTDTELGDVIVAKQGKTLLGYCWTQPNYSPNQPSIRKKARIHMLGVNPYHRGKGIGKVLLAGGLSYLKSKGAEEVELTSDKENQAAHSLYESFGFVPLAEYCWFEKILRNENNT